MLVHAVIIVAGFAALLSAPLATRSLPLLGEPSPTTVTAQSRVTFIDAVTTNRLKQQQESLAPVVYRSNLRQARQSRNLAALLFRNIVGALRNHHLTVGEKRSAVKHLLAAASIHGTGFPRLDLSRWRTAHHWGIRLLDSSLELRPFDSSEETSISLTLYNQTLPRSLPPSTRQAIISIVNVFLTPTQVVDAVATERRRQQAAERVKPQTVTVEPGTVVVRRGQIVTPAILEELHAVGLPTASVDWHQRTAAVVFAAVVVILMLWYLWAFHSVVAGNQRLLLLLDVVVLATAFAAKLAVPGHVLLPFFFPLAGATALTGLLISSEVAVSLAVVLALLVGWIVGGSFELTAYYLLTGVAGGLAVREVRRMNDFILTGGYIALTAGGVIVAFQLLSGGYDATAVRNFAVAAGFNGLVSGSLAFGGFVLFGNVFGVTTTLHLLELGHPDQRLLRRLMAEAPGTHNHSLVVASMAERAAAEIGGDVLLARVMALYHDIGKVANPLCFIENQMGSSNIHDDLRPEESAEIIRAHVTHGVALARQHRLPTIIRDGILQHHGTMTMQYFFHQALREDPAVDSTVFTYPGPRPQTKEAALLMLADGCEGAVRAGTRKSPEIIRDTANRIVDERVAAGQLNECALTLRDLDIIRVAFVEVLNGIYHPRIEYPPRSVGPARFPAGG